MMTMIEKKRTTPLCRILSALTAFSFLFTSVLPVPGYAQVVAPYISTLPAPGTMITLTQAFTPPLMVGVTIHPENPLMFDFIVDKGDKDISDEELKKISNTMIKYFLATITIPEDELWVNLSPYEEGQIIPQRFGETEMGRDFLTQDYLLKQLAASLTYPENELGKKFWDRVYQRVEKEYGITDIPLNTFNKVWIVPDDASVYQDGPTAVVLNSHLKVMLEEDYLALNHNLKNEKYGTDQLQQNDVEKINQVTSQIVREVLIPEIEKEINQGETFANLRQMYSAMILATWYKKNLRDSLLGQVYMDQNKTAGVEVEDKEVKQKIYDQYLESLKKGVYDYIKEDVDAVTKTPIPRQYFSGGMRGPAAVKQFLRERFQTYPKGVQDRIKVLHAGKPDNQRVTLRTVLYEFKESNQLTAEDYEKVLAGIADISEDDAKGILSEMKESNGQSENAMEVKPVDRGMFTAAIEELAGNGFDLDKAREALSKTGQYNGDQIQEAVIFFKEHIDLRKQYPNLRTDAILDMQEHKRIEEKLGDQLYYYTNGMEFASTKANYKMPYIPLYGGPNSLKGALTPSLTGDLKYDVETYVYKPTSREDLRSDEGRNFWVYVDGEAYSLTSKSKGSYGYFKAGPYWQESVRVHPAAGIKLTARIFVPEGTKAEVMEVTVTNLNMKEQTIVPTSAIKIFARAQFREFNHEHVSVLAHRIVLDGNIIWVEPEMAFSEPEHRQITTKYFVGGYSVDGEPPQGMFPTVQSFLGEEGGYGDPVAVTRNLPPPELRQDELDGVEAMGAVRFASKKVPAGEEAKYKIITGMGENKEEAQETYAQLDEAAKVERAFENLKAYWQKSAEIIKFGTKDPQFNTWMKWVLLQPKIRCGLGCGFLPDHDYGKGGRGWRDLWQDLLTIILIEPEEVRKQLEAYFGGVRVDGTNATLITSNENELFAADRDGIGNRVWVDHGTWPLFTLLLYIRQTGNYSILFKENSYYKDAQMSRGMYPNRVDRHWNKEQGFIQKDKNGKIFSGTIIEHTLFQTYVPFFNVGKERNIIRIQGGGWDDAKEKAANGGESEAVSVFYAWNMLALAENLEQYRIKTKQKTIEVAKELLPLMDRLSNQPVDYDDVQAKTTLLEKYFQSVESRDLSQAEIERNTHKALYDFLIKAGVPVTQQGMPDLLKDAQAKGYISIAGKNLTFILAKNEMIIDDQHVPFKIYEQMLSGERESIEIDALIKDLRAKAEWMFNHIQKQEMVAVTNEKGEVVNRFAVDYSDDNSIRLEGQKEMIRILGPDGKMYRIPKDYYDKDGALLSGKEEIYKDWRALMDKGTVIEGEKEYDVGITLIGQTFTMITGAVTHKDMEDIIKSVDKYLKHPTLGGYMLNNDFVKGDEMVGLYLRTKMGRFPAFAFGTKENGAMFSHMIVMYAYGLYRQGFVHEGHKVLQSIYRLHQNTAASKVYPQITEYIGPEGRGMYGYLTGSASWLILTMLTQVFGVRGEGGDLVLEPKLVRAQFREDGTADVETKFADHDIKVIYKNPGLMDYGEYKIGEIKINGQAMRGVNDDTKVKLMRSSFEHLSQDEKVFIEVVLAPKPGVPAKPALVSQDPPVQNLTENLSELVENQVAGYLEMAKKVVGGETSADSKASSKRMVRIIPSSGGKSVVVEKEFAEKVFTELESWVAEYYADMSDPSPHGKADSGVLELIEMVHGLRTHSSNHWLQKELKDNRWLNEDGTLDGAFKEVAQTALLFRHSAQLPTIIRFLRPKLEIVEDAPADQKTAEQENVQALGKGGIDFNAKLLNLQIKRDSQGVPLPLHQQPIQTMQIDGFIPVIINIIPTTNLPLLLGSDEKGNPDSKDLSYQSSQTRGIKPEEYADQEEAPVLN